MVDTLRYVRTVASSMAQLSPKKWGSNPLLVTISSNTTEKRSKEELNLNYFVETTVISAFHRLPL